MKEIEEALRGLGVDPTYCGFRRLVLALELALENEDRLCAVTKEIYYDVGRLTGCTWSAVERSIRTVVGHVWQSNPERLAEMADHTMKRQPTASQFLDIVTSYIRRNRERPM